MKRGSVPVALFCCGILLLIILGVARILNWLNSPRTPAPLRPDLTVSEQLGVFAKLEQVEDADRMRALGMRYMRTDLPWANTEPQRGVYDFSSYIAAAQALQKRGMRPLFILAYGNPVWRDRIEVTWRGRVVNRTSPPVTEEQIKAYADWAAAAARALAPYDPIWEVWNEPDMQLFWPPEPDVTAYMRVARANCRAIREAMPDDRQPEILVGAMAKWHSGDFVAALALESGFDCFDRISLHPYRCEGSAGTDQPLWEKLYARFAAGPDFRERPGAAAKTPLFTNTEWGKSVIGKTDQHRQAVYFARSMVSVLSAGFSPNIIYAWRDRGTDPTYDQDHFGLTDYEGNPKLSYHAIRVLNEQIGDMVFVCAFAKNGAEGAYFRSPAPQERSDSGADAMPRAAIALLLWHNGNPDHGLLDADPVEAFLPPGSGPSWVLVARTGMLGAALEGGAIPERDIPYYLRFESSSGAVSDMQPVCAGAT